MPRVSRYKADESLFPLVYKRIYKESLLAACIDISTEKKLKTFEIQDVRKKARRKKKDKQPNTIFTHFVISPYHCKVQLDILKKSYALERMKQIYHELTRFQNILNDQEYKDELSLPFPY